MPKHLNPCYTHITVLIALMHTAFVSNNMSKGTGSVLRNLVNRM